MSPIVVAATLFFAGSILFVVGIVVLAFGARAWSDATAAAHRARVHGIEAHNAAQVIDDVQDAVEDLRDRNRARAEHEPPSDVDLMDAIVAERAQEREYTTLGNEGFEPAPPIMEGGLYNTGNE